MTLPKIKVSNLDVSNIIANNFKRNVKGTVTLPRTITFNQKFVANTETLFLNGMSLLITDDYTISYNSNNTTVVTLTFDILSIDVVSASYFVNP